MKSDSTAGGLEGMEVISSTRGYTLDYSAALRLARVVFREKPSMLEYQAAVKGYIDLVLREGAELVVSNNLSAGLISQAEQSWSRFYIEHYLPRGGLRKMAYVVGGDMYQKLLISGLHRGTEASYGMEFFESERQAISWLLAP